MPEKNNLFIGIAYGLIMPLIFWLVFAYALHNEAIIMDKPAAPYLIAIGLNLLLIRHAYKSHRDKTANGIMIVTFTLMILIFLFKMHVTA